MTLLSKKNEGTSTNAVKQIRALIPRRFWGDVLFASLCVAIAVLTIIEPLILSDIIDCASRGILAGRYYWIAVVLVLFAVRIALGFLKTYLLYRERNRVIRLIVSFMLNHIAQTNIDTFEAHSPSYFVSRILDEPMSIDGVIDYYWIDGIISLLICVGLLALMATASYIVMLAAMSFIVLDYIISMKLPLTAVFHNWNEAYARLRSDLTNVIAGVKIVKNANSYKSEQLRTGCLVGDGLRLLLKKNMWSYAQRSTGIICRQIGYLSIITLSAVLIANNKLAVGGFAMMMSIYGLLNINTAAAENIIPLYRYGKTCCERLVEIMNIPTEPIEDDSSFLPKIRTIAMEKVSFSYQQPLPVIKELDLCLQVGQITAITGYSGCGKSTLVNLLMGYYVPCSGRILVNEKAATRQRLVAFRRKIGYVGQNGFLFDRTIKENLLYYVEKTAANQDKMMDYIDRFGLTNLVSELPDGIDSMLGTDATTISGGQKQRFCIIREIMKEPDLLILDEFSSHLDILTESEIFKLIRSLSEHMIVLQIAHRPSALSYSDRVLVMDGGRIIAEGNHEEMLSGNLFYRTLLATKKE